jgi:glyceraldehyde 3-phosphate dehydrogenase
MPLTHVKVFGWYDNEMGSYTYRLGELTTHVARSL